MIRFFAEGKTSIKIEVEPEMPDGGSHKFWAYWDAGSDWARDLLLHRWRTSLGERLRSIRQRAYDRGWADAKAKRAKSTQCFTSLNDV